MQDREREVSMATSSFFPETESPVLRELRTDT